MRSQPVVLKESKTQEGIPGFNDLGENVGLAGQTVQEISKGAVDSFEMNGKRLLDWFAQDCPNLDLRQTAPLAVFHRLGQADPVGRSQDVPASADSRWYSVTIGRSDGRGVGFPSVRHVGNADVAFRPLTGRRHYALS